MPHQYLLEPKVFGGDQRLSLSFESITSRQRFEDVVRALGTMIKRNRGKREKPIDRFVFTSQAHADLTRERLADVLAVAGLSAIEFLSGEPGKPTAKLAPLPFPPKS